MGSARMRLSHRGLWLHGRVISAPFPSGPDRELPVRRECEIGSGRNAGIMLAVEVGITAQRERTAVMKLEPG